MSWLFDRLCQISVSDQVDIVLCAGVDAESIQGDSTDLAEVLARAAVVPQLTVTLFPKDAPSRAAAGRALRVVDLDELEPGSAAEAIAVALRQQRERTGTAVLVRGPTLSVVEVEVRRGIADFEQSSHRTVLATDAPGRSVELRRVGRQGLGIAIGGVDPDAQVRVETFLGVVSIIDALVTLRSFAFGCASSHPMLGHDARRGPGDQQGPPPALRRVV